LKTREKIRRPMSSKKKESKFRRVKTIRKRIR